MLFILSNNESFVVTCYLYNIYLFPLAVRKSYFSLRSLRILSLCDRKEFLPFVVNKNISFCYKELFPFAVIKEQFPFLVRKSYSPLQSIRITSFCSQKELIPSLFPISICGGKELFHFAVIKSNFPLPPQRVTLLCRH